MDLGLAGASVCVVGGSRDLGLAVTQRFAAEGARVAVVGRSPAPAADLALSADVRDDAAVRAAFAAIGRDWGALHALVTVVGPPTQRQRWYEIDDDTWADAHDVGVLGPLRAMRAALPLLRAADWARIVTVGAMSVRHPSAHRAPYTSAKAGLSMLTKQVSIDLAPEGILVNAVSPGAMLTDRVRAKLPADVDPDDDRGVMRWMGETSGFAAQTGRIGRPAQVASLIAYLASPANAYVTGADVHADGGSPAR